MQIVLDRQSKTPIYMQIKNQIKAMIYSGELPPYHLLPPERKLAQELGVNRSTILSAYRELKAEGLIDSRMGQGTQVMPILKGEETETIQSVYPISWHNLMSKEAMLSRDAAIIDVLEMSSKDKVISFAAGIAAKEYYPSHEMGSLDGFIKRNPAIPFIHSSIEGILPLRIKISELLKSRQMDVEPEEIMILSGSQQGLDLAARTFIDPGDIVIVEEPTYIGALQIFKGIGAKLVGVPMTENGMRLDILEDLIVRYKPKFIYTIPTFHNPTGYVMDMSHRVKLLQLSYKYHIPIIEDDAYGLLRYEGEELPTLKAMDRHEHVIYLNTFSKCLFPGFRIGYIVAPKSIIIQFSLKKQMMDLHANSFGQWWINDYIEQGLLDKHLKTVRKAYLEKMEAMLDALDRFSPKEMKWNRPQGGFYIWCQLPERYDTGKLLEKAIKAGVAFIPGEIFYTGKQATNYIRLNFTKPSISEIYEGIEKLMALIKETYPTKESHSPLPLEMNPML